LSVISTTGAPKIPHGAEKISVQRDNPEHLSGYSTEDPLGNLRVLHKSLGGTGDLAALSKTEPLEPSREAAGRLAELELLNLSQLEMFESELINQGFLTNKVSRPAEGASAHSSAPSRISQRAALEVAYLKWRSQRMAKDTHLDFVVDVPKYLLHWAAELVTRAQPGESFRSLSNSQWACDQTIPGLASAQLEYLDQFAAYLLGVSDRAPGRRGGRFSLGLELILKKLASPSALVQLESRIILPLRESEFTELQRALSRGK